MAQDPGGNAGRLGASRRVEMLIKWLFIPVQRALVPLYDKLSEHGKRASWKAVSEMLSEKSAGVRARVLLFLLVIQTACLLRYARLFGSLKAAQKQRVLFWFFDSKIALMRKGFWGINTLSKLGVYGIHESYSHIGYVKSPLVQNGNDHQA